MRSPLTALRARLDRAEERGEGGFTLIEMLITMIVFGLAMGLVTQAVTRVEKFANNAQGSADANGEVRLALDDIDRQVRSGNVLYSPANETTPSTCTATLGRAPATLAQSDDTASESTISKARMPANVPSFSTLCPVD